MDEFYQRAYSLISSEKVREAFRLASHKLPMHCKFLVRGVV